MADPYIGEIRMFGGNFAPYGWLFCNGQLLAISEYDTLFALLGTTYGGDGQSTFGLPNLQGRLPMHQGQGYTMGQLAGNETVTLISNQQPPHSHPYNATTATANATSPSGALPADGNSIYTTGTPGAAMDPQGIGPAGGSQPHDNMMPYLAVSFIIAYTGVYPSQN